MDRTEESLEKKNSGVENLDLKLRLLKELDEEGTKAPEEIDVKKVESILDLLDSLNTSEQTVKDDKEQFAKMLREKYELPVLEKKKKPLKTRVVRVAAAAAVFVTAFMTVNFVTARAFDFSVIQWVKRTIGGFYFEYKGDELEKDSNLDTGKDKYVEEYKAEKIKSIQDIKKIMGGDVYIVSTQENDFDIKEIQYNQAGDILDIRYEDSASHYITLGIIKADGEGGGSISVADNNVIEENVSINNFTVTICQTYDKDQTAAIFTYKKYLYEISTDMEPEDLKEIIDEMTIIK